MSVKAWETLDSCYPIKEKWLVVRKDRVLTDKNVDVPDFYVIEYPTWVNVIAIKEDGHFIIEEQYRHGLNAIEFEIPAGACEQDEEPLHAAKRELLEETGLSGGEWTLYDTYAPNPNSLSNVCHTFLALGVKKTQSPHQELTESIDIHLMTIDEVKQLLLDNKIQEGIMAAPLWRYLYENKI